MGSMNRGGLVGSSLEFDDRLTAYDATTLAAMGFEGGKMLVRVALDDPATARTLEQAGHAVSELAERGLMAMLEPFISQWKDGRASHILTAEAVVKSAAIAAGLGVTSRHYMAETPGGRRHGGRGPFDHPSHPPLRRGPTGRDDEVYKRWRKALTLPGVRGLVVGRALLYPDDDDVASAVDLAADMVHGQ